MSDSAEALRAQFFQDMVNTFQTCIRELHYHPTIAMHYMEDHGAVETAHWLVNLRHDPYGFIKLYNAGRL
ncbi:MAG: hypothetical protein ACM3N4_01940, partial [Nitrososphaerota archaeon]